jgi:glutamine amidotransferase-like uncharacterized protein
MTGEKIEEIDPAAIVSGSFGRRKFVLSGVHFEMDSKIYTQIYPNEKFPKELSEIEHEQSRLEIIKKCFEALDT